MSYVAFPCENIAARTKSLNLYPARLCRLSARGVQLGGPKRPKLAVASLIGHIKDGEARANQAADPGGGKAPAGHAAPFKACRLDRQKGEGRR